MVTTLVFLNRFSAFWALFGVSHDPSYVFTLCRVFVFPKFSLLTIARSMRFTSTLKAEGIATFAIHITFTIVLVFNAIVTT
jgi:hypothetical protein